jgi:hypothetical protein
MTEGQTMIKTGLGASLVFMFVFAIASTVHAQSAEDLAKGQSPGVRYVNRFNDEGIPTVNVLIIRGDEITFACEEGRSKGVSYVASRIGNKRTEGNKVILESNDGRMEYTIDGYRLIQRPKSGVWSAGIVYTRE